MKPLSICLCYCASLFACFKAVKVFEIVSAIGVCTVIVLAAWLTIGEIQKTKELQK